MLHDLFQTFKGMLDLNPDLKQVACLLVAVVTMLVLALCGVGGPWIYLAVFVIAWLLTWVVLTLIPNVLGSTREVAQRHKQIKQDLDGLTNWQMQFLGEFVRREQLQIQLYELHPCTAIAHGDEIRALCNKGIIRQQAGTETYEIAREHFAFIKENYVK